MILPKRIEAEEWRLWAALPEKAAAIVVPSTGRRALVPKFVAENIRRLHYEHFKFYLSMHEDDDAEVDIVTSLERAYPDYVFAVSAAPGAPRTRSAELGRMVTAIREAGELPDFVLVIDPEDLLHPKCLHALNALDPKIAHAQMPLIAEELPSKAWFEGDEVPPPRTFHRKFAKEKIGFGRASFASGSYYSWPIFESAGQNTPQNTRVHRILLRDENGELLCARTFYPQCLGNAISTRLQPIPLIASVLKLSHFWRALRPRQNAPTPPRSLAAANFRGSGRGPRIA